MDSCGFITLGVIMQISQLRNAQAVASIFTAIAVPVVVALVGWQIQTSISSDSVRKDYVQMAISILSNPNDTIDKSLKHWAIEVLEKNSPVPFNSDVRANLEQGMANIHPKLVHGILKTPMMEHLPQPWIDISENSTIDELRDNYDENKLQAGLNYLTLKTLQEVVRITAETESNVFDIYSK